MCVRVCVIALLNEVSVYVCVCLCVIALLNQVSVFGCVWLFSWIRSVCVCDCCPESGQCVCVIAVQNQVSVCV